ncbi:hypothetical protein [Caminibacter pacificus]
MIWFAVGAVVAAAAIAAFSSDDSSSSSSGGTYTSTSTSTISEDSVATKKDYIEKVIKETKEELFNKYGAEVKINDDGEYEVICYGDEYKKLKLQEEELLRELNKFQTIEL